MFKIGDRVRFIEHGCLINGSVYTVCGIHCSNITRKPIGVRLDGCPGAGDWWAFASFELVEQMNNKVPHKHAEVIKAWADGAEIETLREGGRWVMASTPMCTPMWYTTSEYRIKPEPKPDIVCKAYVRYVEANNDTVWTTSLMSAGQVQFTYDGETRKLKSVEKIG